MDVELSDRQVYEFMELRDRPDVVVVAPEAAPRGAGAPLIDEHSWNADFPQDRLGRYPEMSEDLGDSGGCLKAADGIVIPIVLPQRAIDNK